MRENEYEKNNITGKTLTNNFFLSRLILKMNKLPIAAAVVLLLMGLLAYYYFTKCEEVQIPQNQTIWTSSGTYQGNHIIFVKVSNKRWIFYHYTTFCFKDNLSLQQIVT